MANTAKWTCVPRPTGPPRPAPGAPAPALLDRPGQEALDEVALEGEEDGQGDCQRDERGRRDQVEVGPELPQLGEDGHRDRLGVAAQRQRDQQVVPGPEELE